MIGFVIVFGLVAVIAWTSYWLEKAYDWYHEGAALFIAALPWLIALACFINFLSSPIDSAIDEAASEPTCQVED